MNEQPISNRIYKGDIFYRYLENDQIYMVRIIRPKSTEKFVCRELNNEKKEFSITRKELTANYSRLNPNAYFSFYVAKLQGDAKDVVVTIHRKSDMNDGNLEPYAVCRQQVTNLFNEILIKDNIMHLGISMSVDTCPPDSNFEDALACNGLDLGETISVYLDESLDSILKLIDTSKYDEILSYIDNHIDHNKVEGSCKSLGELLEYHDLMYDFYLGNGITRIPFEIINNKLDIEQILYLEHLNKHVLVEPEVIEYAYDVDLSKIERAHIKVIDVTKKIYIISYLEGEYVNRYFKDRIKDKRDAVCMLKYTMQKDKTKK